MESGCDVQRPVGHVRQSTDRQDILLTELENTFSQLREGLVIILADRPRTAPDAAKNPSPELVMVAAAISNNNERIRGVIEDMSHMISCIEL
jgi:hypothetical protein